MKDGVSTTPEILLKYYSIQSLAFINNYPTKLTKTLSYPPDSSWNFDYMVRILVRKFYLRNWHDDSALSTKPNSFEKSLIEKRGVAIRRYPSIVTDFSYGWRLGDPDKPYKILLSLSDEYIEDLCGELRYLTSLMFPFDLVDFCEAKERIASLMQYWKKDGYFPSEALEWTTCIPERIINWIFETSSLPPKFPFLSSLKDEGSCFQDYADLVDELVSFPYYSHYIKLFWDIVRDGILKKCPACGELFSRPRPEKRYFSRQIYCSKECRLRAKDHRYYEKHKEEVRSKRREYMRKTRKFYKAHGTNYDKKTRGSL